MKKTVNVWWTCKQSILKTTRSVLRRSRVTCFKSCTDESSKTTPFNDDTTISRANCSESRVISTKARWCCSAILLMSWRSQPPNQTFCRTSSVRALTHESTTSWLYCAAWSICLLRSSHCSSHTCKRSTIRETKSSLRVWMSDSPYSRSLQTFCKTWA